MKASPLFVRALRIGVALWLTRSTGLADDSSSPQLESVLARIDQAAEYTLRIAIPSGGEKVLRLQKRGQLSEETSRLGWRIVPFVLPRTTAAEGKGAVVVTLQFPGLKEPAVLRSQGLATDIFLLRQLGAEKEAAKWMDQVAPDSKLVASWPEAERTVPSEALESVPPDLAAAVKLGKAAYEEKRPELIRRFSRSFLFYPATAAAHWEVTLRDHTLWLDSACADLMYAARFRVELSQTEPGEWKVTRILASEFFKGE